MGCLDRFPDDAFAGRKRCVRFMMNPCEFLYGRKRGGMVRLIVASDLHGNLKALQKIVSQNPGAQGILLAGDYELPFHDIRTSMGEMPLYAVLGNHDEELRGILPEEWLIEVPTDHFSNEAMFMNYGQFGKRASYLHSIPLSFGEGTGGLPYANKRGIRILLVHGHRYMDPSVEKMGNQKNSRLILGRGYQKPTLRKRAESVCANIVVFGHTHVFLDDYDSGRRIRLLNPGALAGDDVEMGSSQTYGLLEMNADGIIFRKKTLA